MELLERSEALGLLDGLLTATATGGRIAVVTGEAGAGKSVLVGEFGARLGPRVRMLWGLCDPLVSPRPLGPLHDIGRQLGGALAERLAEVDADQRRRAVFDALLDALDGPSQRPRPVLVVEDAHWADEATLDLLAFLGRRLARIRVMLVVTCRDDEVGPEHPLRAVLAGLPAALLRRVPLAPLSAGAVAELARRAGRPASGVRELTGGNPLLVTEVLAARDARVPPTVRDLVLSRLASVSPAAREVARLVSVVPSRVEPALLATVPATAVEECLTQGLLVPVDGGVAYRHELLRHAVEESLSPVRRAALHATVLAALTTRSGADPARLVHHAHHADDAAAVLRWAPVAARQATAVGANREAAALYALALPHAAGLPETERADLLEAYASAAYLAGFVGSSALSARKEALAVREAEGDPEKIGEGLRWVSRLAWWSGQAAEARTAARRAVRVLESRPAGRQLAMAYSTVSQLHMLADEHDEAIAWGERALELAHQLGDVETEAHVLVNIGSARLQRGEPGAAEQLEQAYREAAAAGLDDHAARALVNLAGLSFELGDFDRAGPALDRAIGFTTARDLDGYARHLLGYRAGLALFRGDWDQADVDVARALAGPDLPGGVLIYALVAAGRLRMRRGEPDAGTPLGMAAERAEQAGGIQFVGIAAAARAEQCWLAGDLKGAAEAVRPGYALAVRIGHPWYAGELGYWLWRAGEPPETPDAMAAPYRRLVDGDWTGAAAEWQARGCPYHQALALAGGDPTAAAEALRLLDRLGAAATARRVRAELRERGIRRIPRGPRPPTAANQPGLTARQMEVLALVADGFSNAEIAARLSLSAKTVDHHVSAVLGKLHVTTRGQAAVVARRLGLVPPT
jgi:DNA-binding CsgD family transcriptional regulator/tetratricopeptide (TPR) repeat protein